MSQIGLVPSIQNLGQVVQQAEAAVAKTADIMKGVTSPNGLKIPGGASLDKLLGSLPTGISTIASVASQFSSVASGFNSAAQQLSKANGLGGFLNSAIGTAQTLTGAAQSVVGAASSLGINVGALGGLAKELTGIDPTSGTQQGLTPEFSLQPQFKWEIASQGPGLFFPSDLDFNYHPMVQLSIKDYQKATLTQSPTYSGNTSIFLPLPRDLNEDYTPQWSQYSPGPLRMWANEILNGVKSVADNTQTGEQNIYAAATNIAAVLGGLEKDKNNSGGGIAAGTVAYGQMGLYYISGGSDTGSGLLGNFTGRAVNPFTTVAFQGMNLRTHNFVWAFAPKSEEETNTIDKILSVLRVAALPLQKQGGFLMYPKVVSVRFLPVEHYNFKPCVITGLRINHAGSGQPSFFHGSRKPTVYVVALSLQEIEQYTSNDVGVPSENIKPITELNTKNFLDTSDDDVSALFGSGSRIIPRVNLTGGR